MSLEDFSTTNENIGIQQSQKVGPTIAADMKKNAYIAVVLSLIRNVPLHPAPFPQRGLLGRRSRSPLRSQPSP